jgi:spore coat protein U-like protein
MYHSRTTGFILCFVALLLSSSLAFAQTPGPQCTFSASAISFGTVDLKKGNPYDAAGTFTYVCTGDAREILRICPSWGIADDGNRFLTGPGGSKLTYNLYIDEGRHTVWGTWYSKTTKGPSIDVPLGRSQRITGTATVYGRIAANQQSVAPGAYQARIDGGNAAVSYGYASKGSCDSFKHGDRVSVGVAISATVGGEGGPAPITAPDATKPSPTASTQPAAGQPDEKKSLMQKLVENAQYQQQKQNQAAQPAAPDPADSAAAKKEDRAKYIETHACMTTDGADKANQLADDCNKVTSPPHSACSIQQNTCDEIRNATQKGCWGMAASAPDFCLMRYR